MSLTHNIKQDMLKSGSPKCNMEILVTCWKFQVLIHEMLSFINEKMMLETINRNLDVV